MLRVSPLGVCVAFLRAKPFVTSLNIILYAIGVFAIVLLLQLSGQIEQRLKSNSKSIDLIVGAKGSPLQLVLSALYHLDAPTGNIPLSSLELLRSDPLVKQAIPISIGDAVGGFHIVGTQPEFLNLYASKIRTGEIFNAPMQVVLGSQAAQALALNVGDSFVGSHGLSATGDRHASHPFTVVGILEPSGSVIDRLCLTSLESVWQVHQHHDDHDIDHAAEPAVQHQVTALLLQYKSPIAAAILPNRINTETALQAASPAVEITRLMQLLGFGVKTLHLLSSIVVFAAVLSALIALTNMLDQRRVDFATMRALGASVRWVISTVLLQGIATALIGSVIGLGAAHLALYLAGSLITAGLGFTPDALSIVQFEAYLPLIALVVGAISAALPAVRLYRQEVAKILTES